ncbi:hypothetical protein THRCLA_01774, partial [Thraustotheca clavata]
MASSKRFSIIPCKWSKVLPAAVSFDNGCVVRGASPLFSTNESAAATTGIAKKLATYARAFVKANLSAGNPFKATRNTGATTTSAKVIALPTKNEVALIFPSITLDKAALSDPASATRSVRSSHSTKSSTARSSNASFPALDATYRQMLLAVLSVSSPTANFGVVDGVGALRSSKEAPVSLSATMHLSTRSLKVPTMSSIASEDALR